MIEDAMTDLSKCHKELLEKGYAYDFQATEDGLKLLETGRIYKPSEVQVVNYFRFEGISDPDDADILYAIETNDGKKGTLVDAFGAYADPNVAKFMIEVESINKKIPKDDHIITSPVKQAPLESRAVDIPKENPETEAAGVEKPNVIIDEKSEVRKGSGAGGPEPCKPATENEPENKEHLVEEHADGIWGIQSATLQTISDNESRENKDKLTEETNSKKEDLRKDAKEKEGLVRGFDDTVNWH